MLYLTEYEREWQQSRRGVLVIIISGEQEDVTGKLVPADSVPLLPLYLKVPLVPSFNCQVLGSLGENTYS